MLTSFIRPLASCQVRLIFLRQSDLWKHDKTKDTWEIDPKGTWKQRDRKITYFLIFFFYGYCLNTGELEKLLCEYLSAIGRVRGDLLPALVPDLSAHLVKLSEENQADDRQNRLVSVYKVYLYLYTKWGQIKSNFLFQVITLDGHITLRFLYIRAKAIFFFDLLPLTHRCSINTHIGNNATNRKRRHFRFHSNIKCTLKEFVYIGAKAKVQMLPDGFMGNPIECSQWVMIKIKEKFAFAQCKLHRSGTCLMWLYSYFLECHRKGVGAFSLCISFYLSTVCPSGPPWNEGHRPNGSSRDQCLWDPLRQERHKYRFYICTIFVYCISLFYNS